MDFDPLLRVRTAGPDAVAEVKKQIQQWLDSTAMQELVDVFQWEDVASAQLSARLTRLVAQSDVWDFRRQAAQPTANTTGPVEAPRWISSSSALSQDQESAARRAAQQLGMTTANLPRQPHYRAILVLGGARLSCLLRTRRAADLLRGGITAEELVLLGSERPVADSERDATDTYASGARTEFDLFFGASIQELSVDLVRCRALAHEHSNPHLSWEIRECETGLASRTIIISAPSSEPDLRRANSADTYKFYIERYPPKAGDAFLLVTSQIYVPYQQLEALRVITVPQRVLVETVGYPPEWGGPLQGMQGAHHFLQEIRSFLQSAQRFMTTYPA